MPLATQRSPEDRSELLNPEKKHRKVGLLGLELESTKQQEHVGNPLAFRRNLDSLLEPKPHGVPMQCCV